MKIYHQVSRWLRGSALVCGFVGPVSYYDTVINHPYAKATTPDQLIEAVAIQSIATDFDNWVLENKPDKPSGMWHNSATKEVYDRKMKWVEDWQNKHTLLCPNHRDKLNRVLYNKVRDLKVVYFQTTASSIYHYEDEKRPPECFHVNNVPVSLEVGRSIYEAYNKLKKHHERVKAQAAAARQAMEEEEKKWNLAENLLGMKRNEFGALVPIVTVE